MRVSWLNIAIVTLLVISAWSCKKEPNNSTKTYPGWTTYENDYNQFATTLAFDKKGNLWVGTGAIDGVIKFDGKTWTDYSVANGYFVNGVGSLVGDTAGNMWMAAECGLVEFKDTSWIPPYDTTNCKINFWDIGHLALDAQGSIWAGGGLNALFQFNGKEWNSYIPIINTEGFSYIAIDQQGNKWLGTFGYGVVKFDGTNWTYYNTKNGLVSDSILCCTIDSKGNVWVGTFDGVSKFDGTNWTNYTISNSGLLSNAVLSLASDNKGNIWFGTAPNPSGGGVSKFDGTNWTEYNTSNSGLSYDYVKGIAIDGQGNKWFATDGGGVSEYTN